MATIASVEGNKADSEQIRQILVSAGHECESFLTGDALIKALRDRAFDLLIVAWKSADISGVQLVSWLRQTVGHAMPVLFLTDRSREDDVVSGLRAGADDYVVKPASPAELVARVQALLRRTGPKGSGANDCISVGPYVLDPAAKAVTFNGAQVGLSSREFDLALHLFRNADKLVAREPAEQAVWGRSIGPDSRTLATHVSKLRLKLGLSPRSGVRLVSVYSHGYRLETTLEQDEAVCVKLEL